MSQFNIYGTCICRDLFSLIPENRHEVLHFLQSSSPFVNFMFEVKPKRVLTEEDFLNVKNINNFKKKCIINDYNKTVLDYFEKKADFFIIDLVHMANTNLFKEVYPDGTEHYFTKSSWFDLAYKNGLKSNFFDGHDKLQMVNRLDLINEESIENLINSMVDWLICEQGYKEEQIILIENKRANYYSDGEVIRFFEQGTRSTVNDLLCSIYSMFKKHCPKCKVIRMPHTVYSDVHHIWGLTELHFCYEYYEYLYKSIDVISRKAECQVELDALYEKYSTIMNDNIIKYIHNSTNMGNGVQLLKDADLRMSESDFVGVKGSLYYDNVRDVDSVGKLQCYHEISDICFPFAQIKLNETDYYIKIEDCCQGVVGNGKKIGAAWKTVNSGTCVIQNTHSVTICSDGTGSNAQMQIIQTVDGGENMCNKWVTLSVWAKVIRCSSDSKRGGTIAIINATDYNKGIFYAKKEFRNSDWEKIVLTTQLPNKEDFNGLTICLRANSGIVKDGQNAIVEFALPKLEFGVFPTENIFY